MSRFRKSVIQALTAGLSAGVGLAAQAQDVAPTNPLAPATDQATPLAGTGSAGDGPAGLSAPDAGFGLGRPAMPEEIAAWDIDIRPDGQGLPVGSGDVATGEEIYSQQCSACHGTFGEGVGRWPVLAGGAGSLGSRDPVKTVGSYWPFLSTVFDYVHRAMPFGNAQSLTDDEVYAVTAYILNLNFLVEDDFVLSNETFAEVEMPNAGGFFMDDRPEAELSQFSGDACMTDCKASVEITMRAAVLDVTPDEGSADDEELDAAAEVATEQPSTQVESAMDIGTEAVGDGTEEPSDTAASAPAAEPEAAEGGPDPELVAAGEKVFRKCSACHQVGDGAKNRVGPQLNAVVGRTVGGLEGYAYSGTLQEAGEKGMVWNEEPLAAFLADPRSYMKGTKMAFSGLRKETDRQAVVEYLKSFGQ